MRRTRCPWFRGVLAAVGSLFAVTAGLTAGEPAAPGVTGGEPAPPVNIFVDGPGEAEAVWKALADPDFVILRGDAYQRLLGRAGPPGPGTEAPLASAVGAVVVRGTVAGDLAELDVELDVALAADGPVWVDVRLDGQTLTGAAEGSRGLPLRATDAGAWQVELSGRGRHAVRARVLARVRASAEGRRLELAVPESPSTRVDLVVAGSVVDASAGPGEPVARAPMGPPGSGRTRLTADLTPRARLALTWSADEPNGARLAPLLVAQGEIAVDVDPGSFRTRSSWSIRSLRGEARSLVLTLDPDDEVLELELDGQPPQAGIERVDGKTRMTIPLAEPLGPNQERRLVMTTRRPIIAGAVARVAFSGFALADAREQTGAIGVVSSGNLWVTGSPGRGVRQIDPRTELPPELRARPATEQAFRFAEQPFELTLRVEPSPPLVRVVTRTTVTLDPRTARVDSRFDFETARGRLFDLSLGLPPGLEVESVGPSGVVEGWQTGQLPAPFVPGVAFGGLRLLTVRLGPRAQEGSRFSVQVVGRQPIDPARGDVGVALIQPIGAIAGGGRVAVLTDPGLTADLADPSGRDGPSGRFRPAPLGPPADWPWPEGRAPAAPPMLWLRFDDGPSELPLRLTTHARSLTEATALTVRLDRREADVVQDTECTVQFGSAAHLDLSVPAALGDRWQVDGVARRTELGRSPDGGRLVRLDLDAELNRAVRLRFRYRVPLPSGLTPDAPVEMAVPRIKVVGATPSVPPRATVEAATGLSVAAADGSWSAEDAPPHAGADPGASLRLVAPPGEPDPAAPRLRLSARAFARLPALVVSRLWLRTVQGPEGDLLTTASFRVESHDGSLAVLPPPGADLQAARVGGTIVGSAEPLAEGEGAGVRVAFPRSVGSGPVLVELDFVVPGAKASRAWAPPRLAGGGIVQRTLWEVRLPWNRALVGVPSGWSDENEWYWDLYVWKRRPVLGPSALAAWVGASGARAAESDPRADSHGYLFGRPGAPRALPVTVASRALLVAVCSGLVLAVGGVLILVWRPAPRLVWASTLGLGLAVATLVHPSVTFLAVQSGVLGLLLTVLVALMERFVEGRRRSTMIFSEPPSRLPAPSAGSTMSHTTGTSPDDSTAIRVRTVSTMDYVATPTAPATDEAGAGSTRSQPAARGSTAP